MPPWSSLDQLLERQARSKPDAPAIDAPGRRPLSYGALAARVGGIAATLRGLGVEPGDRVALALPNGPEAAVAFLGVAVSAAAAPLNPTYRAEELDFYLSDLGAKLVLVPAGGGAAAREAARARGIRVLELSPDTEEPAGAFALDGSSLSGAAIAAAGPGDVALLLHTSGTTSRPKVVPLTQANLCASAWNVRAALELTPGDRCLNVMPLFHVHGLVAAVLASLAAGGTVVCTPGFYAPEFFRWMDECRPTWYTGVPTMHQAILARAPDHAGIIARRPLRFIRSSSAALPPQVMTELERTFGAPVLEAYGMTEAAHQMTSNPLPPRARRPGSVGTAAGPEVAVMGPTGTLLPAGKEGEVVIRGSNVMRGYENNPAANAAAFADGWFRTGDQGRLDADGYLTVTGRLKEIINRGGEKISPREVDEVLLAHPAVAQAVAFAVPHRTLGEDIAAVVVRREHMTLSAAQLRDFAATRLADFKVPSKVLFVDDIPKGPTGKLQRLGLGQRLGLTEEEPGAPPGARDDRAPRTPVETTLARLWAEVLKVGRVGAHQDFLDLGGDSMLATLLISRIRESFGLELSMRALLDAPTVADQAAVVQQEMAGAAGGEGAGRAVSRHG